jgi:hypothetical protein
MIVVWIIAVPVFLYAFFSAYPFAFLSFAAALKRELRRYYINRYGKRWAENLVEDIQRNMLKSGYTKEEAEKVIEEGMPELIEVLGTEYANERIGRPSFIEENF